VFGRAVAMIVMMSSISPGVPLPLVSYLNAAAVHGLGFGRCGDAVAFALDTVASR
jgi:hypothetical protein